jgi:hypothetical protein
MTKFYRYQLVSPNITSKIYTSESLEDATKYYFNILNKNDNRIAKKFKIRNVDLNKNIEFYGIDTHQRGGSLQNDDEFLNELEKMADNMFSSIVNIKELIAKKKQTNEQILIMLDDKLNNITDKLEVISEKSAFPEEEKKGYCNIM